MRRFRGMHDILVPITYYLATLFESIRVDGCRPPRIRASDMRHVLLVLPFLLHDLLADEVAAFNLQNPRSPVVDPSAELIEITLMLLSWYYLFRRRNPPKTDCDLADLRMMAEAYLQWCEVVFP